jgi:glycosyltransferase involved in cell wall biosynthesis
MTSPQKTAVKAPNRPLVTVGIACFNAADTIERAIRSAMAQDWDNLDILIVDDFSTDASTDIAQRLALEDPRIRLVLHARNLGCAETRTSLLEHARGDFIAFFDDDDESMPGRVRMQYDRIVAHEKQAQTDMIFCYVHRLVQLEGRAENELGRSIGYQGPAPRGEDVLNYMFWHIARPGFFWGHMGSGTLMARTGVFKKTGSFDPIFRRGEEWDIAVRLALQDGHFISVDQPLMIQHITRTQDKAGKAPLGYALLLRTKYKNYLKKRHGYLAARACAFSRVYYAGGMLWRSRLWLLAACVAAPHICLREQLRRKIGIYSPLHATGKETT